MNRAKMFICDTFAIKVAKIMFLTKILYTKKGGNPIIEDSYSGRWLILSSGIYMEKKKNNDLKQCR